MFRKLARPETAKASQPFRSAPFLELEDLLLALWMLVAALVVRYSGRSPLEWTESGTEGSWSWPMIVLLLAFGFVLFTRGSCDTSIDVAVMRRVPMVLPLYFVLPIIASVVSMIRGGEKSIGQPGIGGEEAEWPMPAVRDWIRRLAATPILLVGDSAFISAFEEEQRGLGDEWTYGDLAAAGFFVALPYLIFIIGPRVAVGSTTDWKIWLLRFSFYAAALVSGRQLAGGWF